MKNNIIAEIESLRKEKNAIILAHNYQPADIQNIADYAGDSFELARYAKNTDAEIIVFCGVYFMAESAYILSPEKTVLLPDIHAGCGLADMVDESSLQEFKKKHSAPVVTYINSPAAAKAVSDFACTSANCLRIVEKIDSDTVIVGPDKNLAGFIQKNTRKTIIAWPGYCYVHNDLSKKDVQAVKQSYPHAPVLAHPECTGEVLEISDHVFSTSGMIEFARNYSGTELIICTEKGILTPLKKANERINYIFPGQGLICSSMKLITLKKLRDSLKYDRYRVTVPEDIRKKALISLERMLEYGK